MASHRPYKPAPDYRQGHGINLKNKCIIYDVRVADVCVRLFKEKDFNLINNAFISDTACNKSTLELFSHFSLSLT
jgi:hypothetical protein